MKIATAHHSSIRSTSLWASILSLCFLVGHAIIGQMVPSCYTLSWIDLLLIWGLATFLLHVPDKMARFFQKRELWYTTPEAISVFTLVVFAAIGVLNCETRFVGGMIALIGVLSFFDQLIKTSCKRILPILFLGFLSGIYLVFIIYRGSVYFPLMIEHIITGQVVPDALFHVSIISCFDTFMYPTTGLHGAPRIHYHTGAYFLPMTLGRILEIKMLYMHNLVYPAIFIPLFFKTCALFIKRLSLFRGYSMNLIFGFAFFGVVYTFYYWSVAALNLWNGACITISMCLTLLIFSIILREKRSPQKSFMAFLFVMVLWITWTKVSTGFIVLGALFYLSVRRAKITTWLILRTAVAFVIWTLWCLYFIVSINHIPPRIHISTWNILTHGYEGRAGYLFTGIIFSLVAVWFSGYARTWKTLRCAMVENRIIDLEVLSMATLIGLVGAVGVAFTTQISADVFCFLFPAAFITVLFASVYLHPWWEKSCSKHLWVKHMPVIVFSLCCFSMLFKTKKIIRKVQVVRQDLVRLNSDQEAMKQLVPYLLRLSEMGGRNKDCVYIPPQETWYYRSQINHPEISPFVVPALSGIPLIGGVPDGTPLRVGEYGDYSYSYYTQVPFISDRSEALKVAKEMGYHRLFVIHTNNETKELEHEVVEIVSDEKNRVH